MYGEEEEAVEVNNNQAITSCFDDGITIESGDYPIPTDDVNQLTLSFRQQYFVFDSVTPDKVQAVLLLLGGDPLSPDTAPPLSPLQCNTTSQLPLITQQGGGMEYAKRTNHPQRQASLHRFRQKRKERCFDKKIRYDVRQEVALRMQRKKGQFTSSKSDDSSGCNGQDSGIDENQLETSCTHCGISSKSTPMMRRGPHGPRTLCNACGLFWTNKGTLRDIQRKHDDPSQLSNELGNASGAYRASDVVEQEPRCVTVEEVDDTRLILQH